MGSIRRLLTLVFLFASSISVLAAQSAAVPAHEGDTTAAGRSTTDRAAGLPRTVRYSGVVRGADDATRSGVVALTFTMYSEAQGGAPVWVETQNVTLDAQGRYTALLGSGSGEGLPVGLFARGEARWLGVRVGEEGAAEQARVQLVSVPYALASADAQSLGGRPATDFQLTRAAATADGQAAGSVDSAAINNGSTNGTVNFLPKFDGASTIVDSAIVEVGGRFGLGTTAPNFQMDIQNADASATGANLFRIQSPSVNGATMHFISTSTNGRHWGFGSNFILGNGEFGIYDYTAAANRLYIDSAGRVGLGTTSPAFGLDVRNNDASGAGSALMRLQTPSVNGALIRFISTSANGHDYGFGSNFILGTGEFGVYDYTANASRLMIAGSGNVGIGTSSPSQKLEVAGTVYSSSGGFRFPDNTVQTTAAALVSGTCPGGQYVQAIAANGSVTCGTDQTGAGGIVYPYSSGNQSTPSGAFKVIQTNSVPLLADPTFASAQTGIPAALVGVASNTTNTAAGVVGFSSSPSSPAVIGWNGATAATGDSSHGILGISDNATGVGVSGEADHATGANIGVEGWSNSSAGTGVKGMAEAGSGNTIGVRGEVSSPNGIAVKGLANGTGIGGQFESFGGIPLVAVANGSNSLVVGANGVTTTNKLVVSNTQGGFGLTIASGGVNQVWVEPNGTLKAVSFATTGANQNEFGSTRVTGTLQVTGNLSKGSGTFKIDHPLDPTNKFLYHSFVESPDMMNIYNGVVVLDAKGQVWVTMPDWFEALNMDFRYQLTAIGRPAPNLYIAKEMNGNRFKISGGGANTKVSWQVTGIRQDAYANAHRIQVEEDKPAKEKGTYLHPEAFQKPVVAKK